jgi:hypothetical protein
MLTSSPQTFQRKKDETNAKAQNVKKKDAVFNVVHLQARLASPPRQRLTFGLDQPREPARRRGEEATPDAHTRLPS